MNPGRRAAAGRVETFDQLRGAPESRHSCTIGLPMPSSRRSTVSRLMSDDAYLFGLTVAYL
jgi:hypothetical protein